MPISSRLHAFRTAALALAAAVTCLATPASASDPLPDTLKFRPVPPVGTQRGCRLGAAVATSGPYTVVGAPAEWGSVRGAGAAKVFDTATGTLLFILEHPTSQTGDSLGASVAISGTRVVVSGGGHAFVYDLSSATPSKVVTTLGFQNGLSVAIDGTRIVVGAPFDDTGATDAGSAYVFDLAAQNPTQPVATLNNPTPAANDKFGSAVAISGSRVVVGAPYDDTGATDAGSAYVYDLAGVSPTTPVATLANPTPAASDNFGLAVAISGDRVVIGAPSDDTIAADTGSAYLYDLATGTPTIPIATLNIADQSASAQFGGALALQGTRLLVGAIAESWGRAYAFDLSSGTPIRSTTFANPHPTSSYYFGSAVALAGNKVVIGSPHDGGFYGLYPGVYITLDGPGCAFAYDLTHSDPSAVATPLEAPGPAVGQTAGNATAMSGTLLAVGAPCYGDLPGNDYENGSVTVYDLANTTPTAPLFALANPHPYVSGYFGDVLAMSGTRLVVGSPYYTANGNDSRVGLVCIYDLAGPTPATPVATLTNPAPEAAHYFGYTVAISGSLVVVGTNYTDTPRVYGYDLSSATPTVPFVIITNQGFGSNNGGATLALSGSRLVIGLVGGGTPIYDLASATPAVPVVTLPSTGRLVSFSGNRVAVSSYYAGPGSGTIGAVDVYDLSSPTPLVPMNIPNPFPATDTGNYPDSIALVGDRLLVGSRYADASVGRAYLFDLSSATPATPVFIFGRTDRLVGTQFGNSVLLSGSTVVVGCPLENTYGYNKGATYVFGPASNDTDGDGLLDLWEYAHFGSLTTHTASDDSDHDGLSELMELALNRDPTKPDATPATASGSVATSAGGNVTVEGGYLTLSLTKRAGVTYTVQTANSPADAAFSTTDTTVLLDNATTLKVRDNFPLGAQPGRLIRAKVTAAP